MLSSPVLIKPFYLLPSVAFRCVQMKAEIFLARIFGGRTARRRSAVRREPPFISLPHACRESGAGTCLFMGWKNSAESHLGFHVSNLCFL